MNAANLCLGCMEVNDSNVRCSHCGYQQGSGPESSHHLQPGTVLINKYLIGRVLGQGGFGITYLAWDTTLELKLAIKEFFPMGLVARSAGSSQIDIYVGEQKEQFTFGIDRFLGEAKTLARFSEHPNIVTVRDFFPSNSTAYMVMNYIEGQTFEQYLKLSGGKISFSKALAIMMPVMDALREVHQTGFMHRDVSPDNIFIRNDGMVVLIDFGAARLELQHKSRSMSVIMKVGYSPEEQYRSKGVQGPWTDIYALAATIYRGITGEVPPESMDRLAEDTLLPPSACGVEITESQEQALLKAMEIRAKERYPTVADFQKALLEKPNNEVISHTPEAIKLTDPIELVAAEQKVVNETDKRKLLIVEPITPVNEKQVGDKIPAKQKTIKDYLNGIIPKQYGDSKVKLLSPKMTRFIFIAVAILILLVVASAAAYLYVPIYEVTIEPSEMTLVLGEEDGIFTWNVKPFFANRANIVWDTDNENQPIAYLREPGVVQPLKPGIRTLTLSTEDGNVSSTCVINVVYPTIEWNGGNYTGKISNSLPNGIGVWTHANGESYEGRLVNGQFNGYGEWVGVDGETYKGNWKDGKFDGSGFWTGPDGDTYEGSFSEGKWHGIGSYTKVNGEVEKWYWENGTKSNKYNPTINAIIEGPFFYSNTINIPGDYKNRFSKQEVYRIGWLLRITFHPHTNGKMVNYRWLFYMPDGSVMYTETDTIHSTSLPFLYRNIGWNTAGNWQKGIYRFEFYLDGKKIVTDSFEIY